MKQNKILWNKCEEIKFYKLNLRTIIGQISNFNSLSNNGCYICIYFHTLNLTNINRPEIIVYENDIVILV